MKRLIIIWLGITLVILSKVKADEGMWLLPLIQELNMGTMTEMGLKLTAEDIYSINKTSLKDAIVALDYGSCTAELISADGLIITNHHCGYDEIQEHSSIEHDYLTNGFWAKTKTDELPNPGKTATFVVRMEDVTEQILSKITSEMSDEDIESVIEETSLEIEEKAIEGTHYEATVESFFGGNTYYLVVTETFKDVRLVGAPPESIGKFGHDTDNWVWPRHTGDFSMFRIYCAPDGTPAEYSEKNIPYKPKHHLPISLKGYKKDDFAFVMGFPGSTQRYLTSYGIKELLEIEHPNRIKIRGIKQDIIMEDMMADDVIRIKYSSKYSSSSNYWKYSIGQKAGLEKLKIYDKKKDLETEFTNWVQKDAARIAEYGKVLPSMKEAIEARAPYQHASQYLIECFLFGGSEIIEYGFEFLKLYNLLSTDPKNKEAISEEVEDIKKNIDNFYKDYSESTDKKVTLALLKLYDENVPEENHPLNMIDIKNNYNGDFEKYVNTMFSKTFLTSKDKVEAFLKKPSLKQLDADIAFQATLSSYYKYVELYMTSYTLDAQVSNGEKLFIKGLQEMQPEKIFYPDANSTLRLTYGTVGDYSPRDAVTYDFITTLKGVIEKEDPDNWEFIVPAKLKQLYDTKDYGRYGLNGIMPVCFTTNNDITGGNSGSPVLNGNGELIGLAFDGNWEAMSGDIAFENSIQKCINVDIRYVLFIIDKFAGAGHLIDEMTIIE
ncbi:MAG: S46 family peptidase [Bacteroidales bacterium]|nr:S46 family peptidase [Bacteroidales bacterium]